MNYAAKEKVDEKQPEVWMLGLGTLGVFGCFHLFIGIRFYLIDGFHFLNKKNQCVYWLKSILRNII